MATDVPDAAPRKKSELLERGKTLIDRTKLRMFEYALGEALNVLGHSSEQNLTRIAQLFRAQAKDETSKMVADWVSQAKVMPPKVEY